MLGAPRISEFQWILKYFQCIVHFRQWGRMGRDFLADEALCVTELAAMRGGSAPKPRYCSAVPVGDESSATWR